MDWQLIDTHTGDGTPCLIAGKYPNGVPYVEESWFDPRGWWRNRKLDPPSHWMPLPPPPAN